jgi:hypothetical protein
VDNAILKRRLGGDDAVHHKQKHDSSYKAERLIVVAVGYTLRGELGGGCESSIT